MSVTVPHLLAAAVGGQVDCGWPGSGWAAGCAECCAVVGSPPKNQQPLNTHRGHLELFAALEAQKTG
jgi:hypothetical protein